MFTRCLPSPAPPPPKSLAEHGRKRGDNKGDLREVATEYEARLAEQHKTLCEVRGLPSPEPGPGEEGGGWEKK